MLSKLHQSYRRNGGKFYSSVDDLLNKYPTITNEKRDAFRRIDATIRIYAKQDPDTLDADTYIRTFRELEYIKKEELKRSQWSTQ